MKHIVFWIFFLCLTVPTWAQNPIVDPAGGFSYTPPRGWLTGSTPNSQHKVALAKRYKGFTPNIVVLSDGFGGTFQQFLETTTAQISHSPTLKILQRKEFVTHSGVHGMRWVAVNMIPPGRVKNFPKGATFHSLIYFFPTKRSLYYTVTFSVLSEEGTKYDAMVDSAMKTFAVK